MSASRLIAATVVAISLLAAIGCRKPCYGQCEDSEQCVEWGDGSKFDCEPAREEWSEWSEEALASKASGHLVRD